MQKVIGDTVLHQLLKLQIPEFIIVAGCAILKITLYPKKVSAGKNI
jgi:hypothetical protein